MENLTTLKNEELMEVIGGGTFSCVANTVGSFLNGAVIGAVAGNIVPGLGVFVGGVIGASAGAVQASATSC
ncbi:Blp family class II bacteriocin [Paraclostridium bifermentans]|uniref:Blp family class II bacteriocin n=1 Tax=Paraclostridium bifermentans TaxID=1490 RepID=UPI00040497ED|nr:Blp family class II bacteriocin [Paraclostridium bifermentans]